MSFLSLFLCIIAWSNLGPRPVMPDESVRLLHHNTFVAESTHSYNVRQYRLDINLPMTDKTYACHEQITIMSELPALDTFSLNFVNLVCDSVKREGTPLTFTTPAGLLHIELDETLPQGDSTIIHIFFRHPDTVPEIGYYFAKPPTIHYAHAMTCGCPEENRYWFACFDEPMDKAEQGIMLNLTVPDTFQTCANGLCDSVTTNQDGTKTYWWRHPYPIATYLTTFSASRFATWSDTFVNTNGDTIPVLYFLWPEDSARSHQGFRHMLDMMEFYSDTAFYGPYPFEKYGMVPGYYGFPWGGMEHQTMTMIHTSLISGGDVTLSHELSHMWWGDMVTHVDFRNVWLNEGFAVYSECNYMGHLCGQNYFKSLMNNRAYNFFAQDRINRYPTFDPPEIYNYGNVYCKGAWVQHMLRFLEGDTVFGHPGIFFRSMRTYADSFKYGSVSTDDYCRIHEQVTGLELGWFFNEWIYQAGFPRYSLDWNSEQTGDSWRIITRLGQDNGQQAPEIFHMPLPVKFCGLGLDSLLCIQPHTNPEIDTFVFSTCPDSIVVDPDNWILDSCYMTGIAENAKGPIPEPRILSIAPNPASGCLKFQLSGKPSSQQQLQIYDRLGRLIRTLPYRLTSHGRNSVHWNRTDSTGRNVPAGIYFARLLPEMSTPVEKFVIIE